MLHWAKGGMLKVGEFCYCLHDGVPILFGLLNSGQLVHFALVIIMFYKIYSRELKYNGIFGIKGCDN